MQLKQRFIPVPEGNANDHSFKNQRDTVRKKLRPKAANGINQLLTLTNGQK